MRTGQLGKLDKLRAGKPPASWILYTSWKKLEVRRRPENEQNRLPAANQDSRHRLTSWSIPKLHIAESCNIPDAIGELGNGRKPSFRHRHFEVNRSRRSRPKFFDWPIFDIF